MEDVGEACRDKEGEEPIMKRRLFLTLATACCIAACGEEMTDDVSTASAEQKIVNGQDESGFPAVGAIVTFDPITGDYYDRFCSGTLIRKNWVLTAGHCGSYDIPVRNVGFLMGEHAEYSDDGSLPEGSVIYPVKRIIVHPQFQMTSKQYDIALFELKSDVTDVDPMPWFRGDLTPYVGSQLKAVGYGYTAANSELNDARRRSTDMQVLNVFEAHLFTQGDGSSTCNGDSGGPLALEVDGEWQIGAITSSFITDDSRTLYSDVCLYPHNEVRVEAYSSWILQTMGEEADCTQDPTLCHCPEACRDDGQCEPYRCGEHSTCADTLNASAETLELAMQRLQIYAQLPPEDIVLMNQLATCFSEHSGSSALAYCFDDYAACDATKFPLNDGDLTCPEIMQCLIECINIGDAMDCMYSCNEEAKGDAGRRAYTIYLCYALFNCFDADDPDACLQRNCIEPFNRCYGEETDVDGGLDGGSDADVTDGGMADAEPDAEEDASDSDVTTDADDIDASENDATADAGDIDASENDATTDTGDDAGSADASDDAASKPEDSGASTDSGRDDAAKPSEKDAEIDEEDDDDGDDGCSAIPGTSSGSWLAFLGLPLLFGRRRRRA